MKSVAWLSGLVMLVMAAAWAAEPQETPEYLFQKALHLETAKADYQGAIPVYEKIVKEHGTNAVFAARALLQMGICYEKIGDSDKSDECAVKFAVLLRSPEVSAAIKKDAEKESYLKNFLARRSAQTQKEQSKTPYVELYKIATMNLNLKDVNITNRVSHIVIKSKLPNVKTRDIKLYIDSKTGRIPLVLDSGGTFEFPLQEELLKENPFIIANQPKGTLRTEYSISFSGSIDKLRPKEQILSNQNEAQYTALFRLGNIDLKTFETNLRKQVTNILNDAVFEQPEFIVWGTFMPKTPTNAPAIIHSKKGDIKVMPDVDGVIRMQYDPQLGEENPLVTFPSAGAWKIQMEGEGKTDMDSGDDASGHALTKEQVNKKKSTEELMQLCKEIKKSVYARGGSDEEVMQEVFKWFKKAAEQGNPQAMCLLGALYAEMRHTGSA